MVSKCMVRFSPILTMKLIVPIGRQRERFFKVHMHL